MRLYTDTKNTMLSLDDIALLPSSVCSEIESRKNVNPYINDANLPNNYIKNRLPIFVSPMTSVVCPENMNIFTNAGFIPVLPRIGVFEDRCYFSENDWTAFSLKEFEQILDDKIPNHIEKMYILVDIANGHMKKLYDLSKRAKKEFNNIILMVGNIADAHMYEECCKTGVDYVRVGIGGGSACTTSVQTGIHVSFVDIITQINEIRLQYDNPTKVIADGGINTIDKIVKCLALGYDCVMVGKLFSQTYEACGEIRTHIITADGSDIYADNNILSINKNAVHFSGNFQKAFLERKYYGMSSKLGQIDISGGASKNPEGISTWVQIKWPLNELKNIIESSLRSAMSYTNSTDLQTFKDSDFKQMTHREFELYYK